MRVRRRVRQLALISTEAERGGLRQRVRKGKQSAASLHFFFFSFCFFVFFFFCFFSSFCLLACSLPWLEFSATSLGNYKKREAESEKRISRIQHTRHELQPKQCSEGEREIERDKEQDRYVQKAKANQEKLLGFRKLQYGLNWPVSQKKKTKGKPSNL